MEKALTCLETEFKKISKSGVLGESTLSIKNCCQLMSNDSILFGMGLVIFRTIFQSFLNLV